MKDYNQRIEELNKEKNPYEEEKNPEARRRMSEDQKWLCKEMIRSAKEGLLNELRAEAIEEVKEQYRRSKAGLPCNMKMIDYLKAKWNISDISEED